MENEERVAVEEIIISLHTEEGDGVNDRGKYFPQKTILRQMGK